MSLKALYSNTVTLGVKTLTYISEGDTIQSMTIMKEKILKAYELCMIRCYFNTLQSHVLNNVFLTKTCTEMSAFFLTCHNKEKTFCFKKKKGKIDMVGMTTMMMMTTETFTDYAHKMKALKSIICLLYSQGSYLQC